jgi:hypothetical protein
MASVLGPLNYLVNGPASKTDINCQTNCGVIREVTYSGLGHSDSWVLEVLCHLLLMSA